MSLSAACSGRALGGVVGAGLGLCKAGRKLQEKRISPGNPTGSPVPKWAGKGLAVLSSIPPPPPLRSPLPLLPLYT